MSSRSFVPFRHGGHALPIKLGATRASVTRASVILSSVSSQTCCATTLAWSSFIDCGASKPSSFHVLGHMEASRRVGPGDDSVTSGCFSQTAWAAGCVMFFSKAANSANLGVPLRSRNASLKVLPSYGVPGRFWFARLDQRPIQCRPTGQFRR